MLQRLNEGKKNRFKPTFNLRMKSENVLMQRSGGMKQLYNFNMLSMK